MVGGTSLIEGLPKAMEELLHVQGDCAQVCPVHRSRRCCPACFGAAGGLGMDPMEVFKVRDHRRGGVRGQEVPRDDDMDILQDLGLIRSIGTALRLRGRQKAGIRSVRPPEDGNTAPACRDVADVAQAQGGFQIKVNDEEHMSDLLKVLWAKYGRERVEQPSRDVVVVASDAPPSDLPVADLEAEFRQDLTDALLRIAPEGFS